MKQRTTYIATVGKTADPILEGLRAIPADEVILLHSGETKDTADAVAKKYSAFASSASVRLQEVDQLDFESTLVAALTSASGRDDHRIVINITGGTKIMAPAALLAAFIVGAEAVYIKEDKKGEMPLSERVLSLPVPRVNISALSTSHRKILALLERYETEERLRKQTPRAFLIAQLEKTSPTLTHHIRTLERHRLVETAREGREQTVKLTPSGKLYAKLVSPSPSTPPEKTRRRT